MQYQNQAWVYFRDYHYYYYRLWKLQCKVPIMKGTMPAPAMHLLCGSPCHRCRSPTSPPPPPRLLSSSSSELLLSRTRFCAYAWKPHAPVDSFISSSIISYIRLIGKRRKKERIRKLFFLRSEVKINCLLLVLKPITHVHHQFTDFFFGVAPCP